MYNLRDFFCISSPEEILLVVMSLLIISHKEKINLRDKCSIINILASAILIAITTIALRVIGIDMATASIIQLVLFIAVLKFIFKLGVVESVIGVLVTIVFYTIVELISVSVLDMFSGLRYNELKTTELNFVLYTIPERIIQFVSTIGLFKLPRFIKIPKKITLSIKFVNVIVALCSCVILIALITKKYIKDSGVFGSKEIITLCIIDLICLVWAITSICNTYKFSNKLSEKDDYAFNALLVTKTLLSENDCDIIEVKSYICKVIEEIERSALK